MPKRINIVALGEIDIFLRERVGILLTKRTAIKTVKKGVMLLISSTVLS